MISPLKKKLILFLTIYSIRSTKMKSAYIFQKYSQCMNYLSIVYFDLNSAMGWHVQDFSCCPAIQGVSNVYILTLQNNEVWVNEWVNETIIFLVIVSQSSQNFYNFHWVVQVITNRLCLKKRWEKSHKGKKGRKGILTIIFKKHVQVHYIQK